MLGTLLNVRFYLDFMADLRERVPLGTLTDLAEELAERYARKLDRGQPDGSERGIPIARQPGVTSPDGFGRKAGPDEYRPPQERPLC